jgi:hypothetical protein
MCGDWAWQYTSVIPETQEAEAEHLKAQGQPGLTSETLCPLPPPKRSTGGFIYRYIGSSQVVEAVHVFTKLWTMPFPVLIVISDK